MPDPGGIPVWVLSDDRPGNRHQAMGVAQRLSSDVTLKTLRFNWRIHLPNRLLGPTLKALAPEARRALKPPHPRVIISVGRRAAPVAAWLKRRYPALVVVHLMRPELPPSLFDLVVVPDHDRGIEGPSVLRMTGSPNHLTPQGLAEAAAALKTELGNLPPPYLGLVAGGRNRAGELSPKQADILGQTAAAVAREMGGSLLVTTSRRTSFHAGQSLIGALNVPYYAFLWGNSGPNPYPGMLGLAEALIVTGDSTAMVSECCASGRPVYVADAIGSVGPKQRRFLDALYAGGHARPLHDIDLPFHPMTPLDTTGRVTDAIRRLLQKD